MALKVGLLFPQVQSFCASRGALPPKETFGQRNPFGRIPPTVGLIKSLVQFYIFKSVITIGLRLIIIVYVGVKLSYGLNMKSWACELN